MTNILITNLTKLIATANAKQGVAFDGIHIYTTDDTHLYKYTLAGTLITSITYTQVNNLYFEDFCIVDGVIYLPLTNYNNTPRAGVIRKYNTSDLSFIGEIALNEAIWPASISYKELAGIPYFWLTTTEAPEVHQYNEDFVLVETHILPYTDSIWPGYSGCDWVGDYFVGNKHGGAEAGGLDIYEWNGSGFVGVERQEQPTNLDQGICYHAASQKMYWCARNDGRSVWTSTMTISDIVTPPPVSRVKEIGTINGINNNKKS